MTTYIIQLAYNVKDGEVWQDYKEFPGELGIMDAQPAIKQFRQDYAKTTWRLICRVLEETEIEVL